MSTKQEKGQRTRTIIRKSKENAKTIPREPQETTPKRPRGYAIQRSSGPNDNDAQFRSKKIKKHNPTIGFKNISLKKTGGRQRMEKSYWQKVSIRL